MRKIILFAVMASFFWCAEAALAASKKEGGKEFVKLNPLILPIIDNDGVQQVVNLVVTIEVDDSAGAEKVRSVSPRLTDAYLQDMYGILHKHAALKGGIIQLAMIKERLNKITHKVVGEDIHTEVLLQHVEQRPI